MKEYEIVITEHKKHVMNVLGFDKEDAIDRAETEFVQEWDPSEDWSVDEVVEINGTEG